MKIKSNLKIKKSDFEYIFLTFYFAISPISKLLEKLWIPRPVTYMVMLSALAIYIINRFRFLKRKPDVLVALLILLPITLFGVLFHHSDFNSSSEMYAMIIIFFPAYFIVRAADVDKLIRALHTSAYIGIAIYLPNAFLVENIRSQYMTYGYDLLFPLSIILYYATTEKRWYDISISIVGTIMLAVFGSRGASIALVLFYLYVIFSRNDKHKVRNLVLVLLSLCAVLFANAHLSEIILWLARHGVSSYSLTRYANGQAFTSYARDGLYEYILTELLPNNYFGHGPLGNRALMPVVLNHDIRYPHQLFFELLIDYGLILGSVFSFIIIYVTSYMLIKSKDKYRHLTSLFCVVSFFPLMISGTLYSTGTIPYIFAIYMKYRYEKES